MSANKRNEETFRAKVTDGWRICVYEPVRKSLGLEMGEYVRVTIRKEERRETK